MHRAVEFQRTERPVPPPAAQQERPDQEIDDRDDRRILQDDRQEEQKGQEGKKETAFKIFSSLKLNHADNQKLKLEDWLTAANIIPDTVIYQYNL